MGNLQPLVTQTLLPGTKEAYGQFPLLDFNQLEQQPFYGIRSNLDYYNKVDPMPVTQYYLFIV